MVSHKVHVTRDEVAIEGERGAATRRAKPSLGSSRARPGSSICAEAMPSPSAPFTGSKGEPPEFTRGHGLTLGACDRKAISMSLVDRALQWRELGEDFIGAPAQDEEFVPAHADNVQATGFLEHIKLPHQVGVQAELEPIRRLRREAEKMREAAE
jgi:hypothetical protein